MMTAKQIIDKIKEEKHYRSIRSMEIDFGFSVGFLADIRRGEKGISVSAVNTIIAKYPDISREWLLSGEGYMYNDQAQKETAEAEFQKLEKLYLDQIEDLKRQITRLEKKNNELTDAVVHLSKQVSAPRTILTIPTHPQGVAEAPHVPTATEVAETITSRDTRPQKHK